jgi:hypothetical protein
MHTSIISCRASALHIPQCYTCNIDLPFVHHGRTKEMRIKIPNESESESVSLACFIICLGRDGIPLPSSNFFRNRDRTQCRSCIFSGSCFQDMPLFKTFTYAISHMKILSTRLFIRFWAFFRSSVWPDNHWLTESVCMELRIADMSWKIDEVSRKIDPRSMIRHISIVCGDNAVALDTSEIIHSYVTLQTLSFARKVVYWTIWTRLHPWDENDVWNQMVRESATMSSLENEYNEERSQIDNSENTVKSFRFAETQLWMVGWWLSDNSWIWVIGRSKDEKWKEQAMKLFMKSCKSILNRSGKEIRKDECTWKTKTL